MSRGSNDTMRERMGQVERVRVRMVQVEREHPCTGQVGRARAAHKSVNVSLQTVEHTAACKRRDVSPALLTLRSEAGRADGLSNQGPAV